MFDTLVDQIVKLGDTQPDRLAVAFKKDRLTYGALKAKMLQISGCMAKLGVEPGDRVLIMVTSKPEMVTAYLAAQYLRAVVVFVDKNASDDTAVFIYQDAGAKIFFTDKLRGHGECNTYSLRQLYMDEGSDKIDYRIPKEDDLAEMIYTSGTTGRPKGVMLTYKAVNSIWNNTIVGAGMRNDDRILLPLPLNHSFALRVLRAGLYLGAAVILQNGFTFAKEIENNLDAYHCAAIAIVPASVETISRQMQGRFADIMGRFRYIEVSAGSLSVEQRKRLARQLPDTAIINSWGSSESGGALFLNVTEEAKSGDKIAALGKPLDCVAVKTLDERGVEFKSDREHPGRMAIKGDMQMAGYWKNPELTAKTLKDGWLVTGDMIYIDEDGYVYMLGRADDMINVGGEKVSPVEVENIAGEYGDILECACIGVPDPEGTDNPVSREILERIVMTGYHAPSGHNMQTWKFTVLTKSEDIQKLKEAVSEAASANNVYFYGWENPAAMILISNDDRNPNGCQDASCAAENIMIAAWSYGVGTVWLNPLRTLRNAGSVKPLLDSYGIPENHIIWSTIALGYPITEGVLLKKKTGVVKWIE